MANATAYGLGDGRADPELAAAAATGEREAFEELYRRNVPVAWRVAQAVAPNPDDASDAVADAFERVFRAVTTGRLSAAGSFRPYLLTATRRAAIDISRRARRTAPTCELGLLERESSSPGPPESAVAGVEAGLLVRAFRELPQRWRSVLWLLEVEELSCQEAATVLGLTPNNVAQLAVRARIGLRKGYLGAVARDHARPECQPALERLATYAEGGLRRRQAARVDEHLAGCDACRRRLEELHDVGTTLRRSALPVPVLLGSLVAGGWARLGGRSDTAGAVAASLPVHVPNLAPVSGWVSGFLPQVAGGTPVVERVVAWAAAGLLVLGISAGVVRTGIGAPTGDGGEHAAGFGETPPAGPGTGPASGRTSIDLPGAGAPAPAPTGGAAGGGASANSVDPAPRSGDPVAPVVALAPLLAPVSIVTDRLPVEAVGGVLALGGAVGLPAAAALTDQLPLPAAVGPEAFSTVRSLPPPAPVGAALEPGGVGLAPATTIIGPVLGGLGPGETTEPQPAGP